MIADCRLPIADGGILDAPRVAGPEGPVFGIRHSSIVNRQFGFTLIEMLMVVAVMGILFGLVSSAVLRSRKGAVKRKAETDSITLAAAARAYYHQFGEWPISGSVPTNVWVFANDNYLVIQNMVSNKLGRSFLNPGEYTFDDQGNVVTPWGERYTFVFNPTDRAKEYTIPSRGNDKIGADSMKVRYFEQPGS